MVTNENLLSFRSSIKRENATIEIENLTKAILSKINIYLSWCN
jgi:hypothetical protein